MSLETWIEAFYKLRASNFSLDKRKDDTDCVKHAIKKWKGALPKNTKKHNLVYDDYMISPYRDKANGFIFGESTCSLCKKYPHDCKRYEASDLVIYCPIVRMQGDSCVDDCAVDGFISTYRASKDDPKPVIDLLKKTLEFVKTEMEN